jgi:hypothetical protein
VRERVGVLVIRAWKEGEPPTIRLRITTRFDLEGDEERTTAASTVDDACGIVRDWLEEFASHA